MSAYQCSTCGDFFSSFAEMQAHKRASHRGHAASARWAGRRVVAAAFILFGASVAMACGDPSTANPAYAAPVEPDPMPALVSPEPICATPDGPQSCSDVVAVGVAPTLPPTGATIPIGDVALIGTFVVVAAVACIAIGRRGRSRS